MLRVAIFGAGGRIGRATIASLLGFTNGESLHLALVSRTQHTLEGIVADLRSIAPWIKSSAHDLASLPPDIAGFDLIIVLSGSTASEDDRRSAHRFDHTGRLAQSLANSRILWEIATALLEVGGEPNVLIVSNQSDHMTYLLRRRGLTRVFGFGLMLDALRYRTISGNGGGIAVGFHSARLLIPAACVPVHFRGSLAKDIESVVASGSHISQQYKREARQGGQTGSVFGPALCLAQTIAAFGGMTGPLVAEFNVARDGHPLSAAIGSDADLGMGLPLLVGQGRLVPAPVSLSTEEIALLRRYATETLEEANFVEHWIR